MSGSIFGTDSDQEPDTGRWVPLDFEAIERDGVPPVDWIFPDWIVTEDIFLVAGDAGVGKSTLASRLAYAAASGSEWVGIKPTRKLRVMYVDEEQSEAEVYGLFTKHGPRLPAEDLRVFVQQGANLDTDEGLTIIEREIADYAPQLVLIDSATAAFGNIEGNSTKDVAAIFRRLFHLRRTYHLTTGFLHHLGKPGETRRSMLHRVLGSVTFGTQASAVFGVVSHDADSIELSQAKRRLSSKPYPSMIVGYREEETDGVTRCYLENRGPVEDKTGAVAGCTEWIVAHLTELGGGPVRAGDVVGAGARQSPPYTANIVEKGLKHGLKLKVLEKPTRGWYGIPVRAALTLVQEDRRDA